MSDGQGGWAGRRTEVTKRRSRSNRLAERQKLTSNMKRNIFAENGIGIQLHALRTVDCCTSVSTADAGELWTGIQPLTSVTARTDLGLKGPTGD